MGATAAAASAEFTVTRTSSEPARASALTCSTVPAISAVSVLVMDWMTMGLGPPTRIPPTVVTSDLRRGCDIGPLYRLTWRQNNHQEVHVLAGNDGPRETAGDDACPQGRRGQLEGSGGGFPRRGRIPAGTGP